MQSSLSDLANYLPDESFKSLSEFLPVEFMRKKGVYPYEYMNSFDRFDETELPPIDEFYSSLNLSNISNDEYEYAQKVWSRTKL